MTSYALQVAIATSFVLAIPLIFCIYMVVRTGRSSFQAYCATVYVVFICLLWFFAILAMQMYLVPKLFGTV